MLGVSGLGIDLPFAFGVLSEKTKIPVIGNFIRESDLWVKLRGGWGCNASKHASILNKKEVLLLFLNRRLFPFFF